MLASNNSPLTRSTGRETLLVLLLSPLLSSSDLITFFPPPLSLSSSRFARLD